MVDSNELFDNLRNARLYGGVRTWIKDQQKAIDLLAKAKSDLKSCKILYEHGQYSDSVFYLQQASEKACKSFLLFYGLLQEKDLKEVGHSSDRINKRAISRGDSYLRIMSQFDPHPEEEKENGEIALASKAVIMKDIAKREEYAKNMLAEVETRLRQLSKYKENAVDAEKIEKVAGLKTVLGPIIPVFSIVRFTSPHAGNARYLEKPINYNLKLGIVDATPELIVRLDGAIQAIEATYDN